MKFGIPFIAVVIKKGDDLIFIAVPAKDFPGNIVSGVAGSDQQEFFQV
jgi:hypothetical protein